MILRLLEPSLRLVAAVTLITVTSCSRPDPPETPPLPTVNPHPVNPAPSARRPAVHDCATLLAAAQDNPEDAALVDLLCPNAEQDPVLARALALKSATASQAATTIDRLAEYPDLQGIARLAALDAPRTVAARPLPRAQDAAVSPLDETVLSQVRLAYALIGASGVAQPDRTNARAFLSKVYVHALRQTGFDPAKAPKPLQRLLAGRALHHARNFCISYWQRRVTGLAHLFAEMEVELLTITVGLEQGSHRVDDAMTTTELSRARAYVRRKGPRGRIENQLKQKRQHAVGYDKLAPSWAEVDRLIDHRLVDLATQQAIRIATEPAGPGLEPVEQLLGDTLRGKDADEYAPRVRAALARRRKASVAIAERGPGELPTTTDRPWPSAGLVADEAYVRLNTQAPQRFTLYHQIARATVLLQRRPDALAVLVDRHPNPDRPTTAAVLRTLVQAAADNRLAWSRRAIREPTLMPKERQIRLRFAVAARNEGRQPR